MKTKLAVFFLALFLALSVDGGLVQHRRLGGAAVPYTADAALFASNDQFSVTSSGPAGLADGKAFTINLLVEMSAGSNDTGSYGLFYIRTSGASARLRLMRQSSGQISLIGWNAANSIILNVSTPSNSLIKATGAVCLHIVVDLAQTSTNSKIYINDVSQSLTYTTFTNDTLDLVNASAVYEIAAVNGGNDMEGTIGSLWFDDSYIDNPAGFGSGNSRTTAIGATGDGPGTPVFFLEGSGNAMATSALAGPNWTAAGTTTADTLP